MTSLDAFLDATVRLATPLALAAMGELLVERAGLINVGLEGIMLAGALGSAIGARHGSLALGFAMGLASGVAMSLLFLIFAVFAKADQIVTGTAVTLFAAGATGTLYRSAFGVGGVSLTLPTAHAVRIPVLAAIPVIGGPLFNQPAVTYVAMATVAAIWWWMYRTQAGLALRATGESPGAATAAGISLTRIRTTSILVEGLLGGLAGATLVLAQAGSFAEGMSAGRGFIAIAIVALGRWHPGGVALAALVFGAAGALEFLVQALGWPIPYQLVLAIPYLLTIVALARVAARGAAPAGLARLSASD